MGFHHCDAICHGVLTRAKPMLVPCSLSVKISELSRVWMTHAYNPSYSGGRDQEDHSSKPAWTNSSQDPISKKLITQKKLVEWLKV
jgi:hypothetical protein